MSSFSCMRTRGEKISISDCLVYAYTRRIVFVIGCIFWRYSGVETYGVLLIASRGKGPLRGPKWINWGESSRVDGLTGSIHQLVRFLGS